MTWNIPTKTLEHGLALPQFDIVFRGVREGFDAAQVKTQFATLFKLEASRVERIFNAKKVTIKANISDPLADNYIKHLAAIGLLVDKLPIAPRETLADSPPAPSKAIHIPDRGNEFTSAHPMHQPVEFVYGEQVRRIPLVFNGSGITYAKIWVVNVLVCLFTAGILLPWAQARSHRYFYQHTSLDGKEFGYTAQLNKTLLVQVLLTAYIGNLLYSFFYSPGFFVLGLAMLMGLLPLFILKLSQFHLGNSSYREITLQDNLSILGGYITFLFLPLAIIATAGLAAPWAALHMQQRLVRSKSFGKLPFSFRGRWASYLPLLPPVIIADLVSAGVFYWSNKIPFIAAVFVLCAAWLMVVVRWRVILIGTRWNATFHPLGHFAATWDLTSYSGLLMRNIGFCILTLGLYWPWAKINNARYGATHLAFFANLKFKKWRD